MIENKPRTVNQVQMPAGVQSVRAIAAQK